MKEKEALTHILNYLREAGYHGANAETLIIGGEVDSLSLILLLTELGTVCRHNLELREIHRHNPEASTFKLSAGTLAKFVGNLDGPDLSH